MNDSYAESLYPICESNSHDRRLLEFEDEEESDRKTKRIRTERHQNESTAQSSDEEMRETEDNGSDIEDGLMEQDMTPLEVTLMISSDEEEITETFTTQELKKKLNPLLGGLVLKGCLDASNASKSFVVREFSKYCAHNYRLIEMLAKNLSAIDLRAERNLMIHFDNSRPLLRCLRLSHCILSVDLMKSIKSWLRYLQCLHLEYIYGIETKEEWTAVGEIFGRCLSNFSFNAGSREVDLSGLVGELKSFRQLALEEYTNDMSEVFSSVSPHMSRLSLVNYYNVDEEAIKVLADNCGRFLKNIEMVYHSYDKRRANSLLLFPAICRLFPELDVFTFKLIDEADMRPVFKLTKLITLDIQFSRTTFVDFPGVYHLLTLRSLSLTRAQFTPSRIESMVHCFPYLKTLSFSGTINKHFLDSAVFCCECKKKDKTIDLCSLCYQNCFMNLVKFSFLKTLKLNYVKLKSSLSIALPLIPSLKRLVLNPFECDCSRSLLMSAIKIAEFRPFFLVIRSVFMKETLEEGYWVFPENLQIIDYEKYSEEK